MIKLFFLNLFQFSWSAWSYILNYNMVDIVVVVVVIVVVVVDVVADSGTRRRARVVEILNEDRGVLIFTPNETCRAAPWFCGKPHAGKE